MKNIFKNRFSENLEEETIYTLKEAFQFTSKLLPMASMFAIIVTVFFSTNRPFSFMLCVTIAVLGALSSKLMLKHEKNYELLLGPLRLLIILLLMAVSGKTSPSWLMAIPAIGAITFTVIDRKQVLRAYILLVLVIVTGNLLSGKGTIENLSITLGLIFFMIFLFQSVIFLSQIANKMVFQKKEIDKERAKSEHLLLNILPQQIVNRLKNGETTIADHFDSITILFADIVGFTKIADKLTPSEVVKLLDTIFSEFDKLTNEYGLEKIKTIGDAYMVVGGMPDSNTDHIQKVAEMSYKFHRVVSTVSLPFCEAVKVRIGIHTGEIVAGIIGQQKIAYDLWGDTVNIASRMESHGAPGETHCSEVVYEKLKDQFAFEERGDISIKGKGEMRTYFLK